MTGIQFSTTTVFRILAVLLAHSYPLAMSLNSLMTLLIPSTSFLPKLYRNLCPSSSPTNEQYMAYLCALRYASAILWLSTRGSYIAICMCRCHLATRRVLQLAISRGPLLVQFSFMSVFLHSKWHCVTSPGPWSN